MANEKMKGKAPRAGLGTRVAGVDESVVRLLDDPRLGSQSL